LVCDGFSPFVLQDLGEVGHAITIFGKATSQNIAAPHEHKYDSCPRGPTCIKPTELPQLKHVTLDSIGGVVVSTFGARDSSSDPSIPDARTRDMRDRKRRRFMG
jgi:hypothetical protein